VDDEFLKENQLSLTTENWKPSSDNVWG